jgi:excisionase family DNA binding protein
VRTSGSRSEWIRAEPIEACDSDGPNPASHPGTSLARQNGRHSQNGIALTDYPDVGRVVEVAAVLRCSRWCVYDLINTGALKSIRLGRAIRVTRRALEEFLAG